MALALEVGWPAFIVLVLATLLGAAAALHVLEREQQQLQERRWLDVLSALRRRVEADLALGFKLADSERSQALLERTEDASAEVRELSIFDLQGQTLFDTDRSAIGERARPGWLLAAGTARWRVRTADAVTIGLPLMDRSRAVAGHITLTLSLPQQPMPWVPLAGGCLLVTGLALAFAMRPLARLEPALEPAHGAGEQRLDDAERRLAEVEAALHVGARELVS